MIESPQGSRVDDFRSRQDLENRKHESKKVLLPYLIMMATQLPLSLIYLKNLFLTRPHYKLMPVAFVATALFLYLRWPRKDMPSFFPSVKSDLFLVLSIFFGVTAAIWLSPWLGYAAFLSAAASLLARTNDRHVFGNLLPALAPMVVLLKPPIAFDFDTSYGDVGLLAYLNSWSAHLANDILDLAQYAHNYTGNTLELVSQRIDSLQFGNGGLSLYTLLIVTSLFITWQRRPMFRAGLLLVAACFWFMTCEALSLAICGVSMDTFETDLFSAGDGNRLLQFTSLLSAGLLTLLSDRLIAFFFGPVDISAIDEDISYQDMVCRFWNNALAGVVSTNVDVNIKKEVAWAKRRNSMPSVRTQSLLWILGMGSIALAVMQVQGLISAFSANQSAITSSKSSLSESVLQKSMADLPLESHKPGHSSIYPASKRAKLEAESSDDEDSKPATFDPIPRDTPFHTNKNHWVYQRGGIEYHVLVLQPFVGWYDEKADLLNNDWRTTEYTEDVTFTAADGVERTAQYEIYRDSLANFRSFYSYQIDGFGRPFTAPLMWKDIGGFIGRSFSALKWRSHPRILDDRSIQICVYVDSIGPAPEFVEENCRRLFMEVAARIVEQVVEQKLETAADD